MKSQNCDEIAWTVFILQGDYSVNCVLFCCSTCVEVFSMIWCHLVDKQINVRRSFNIYLVAICMIFFQTLATVKVCAMAHVIIPLIRVGCIIVPITYTKSNILAICSIYISWHFVCYIGYILSHVTCLCTLMCWSGLRYRTYAGDEIAIITTVPPPVIEITQTQKVLWCPMQIQVLLGES